MGRRTVKSQTLPSSPTHSLKSSSSSDFEFAVSVSPRKSSAALCPADELFYKDSAASRDSTASRSSNESGRSSFSGDLGVLATVEDDELKRLNTSFHGGIHNQNQNKPKFSLSRFSSVFRKEPRIPRPIPENQTGSSVKRVSVSAKEMIRRYLKKVKPLYEKLSKQHPKMSKPEQRMSAVPASDHRGLKMGKTGTIMSHSFSGNLGYPRRRKTYVASCPSSMRSSPSHSGALNHHRNMPSNYNPLNCDVSSMEELQNAIQGAIMHCKNSMNQG